MPNKRVKKSQVLSADKKRAKQKVKEGANYVAPGSPMGSVGGKTVKREPSSRGYVRKGSGSKVKYKPKKTRTKRSKSRVSRRYKRK